MRQIRLIIASLLVFGPLAANADLIQYEFVSDVSPGGWTLGGSVLLDEADVISSVNLVSFFDSWEFSWTNGTDSFSLSSADSIIEAGSSFFVDPLLAISYVRLCSDPCSYTAHPVFYVIFNGSSTMWQGTTSTSALDLEESYAGSWSGPTRVPEPSTLALLGIGLFGMGLSRRRKKF